MHPCWFVCGSVDAVQQALVSVTGISTSDQIVMCHGARLDPAKPLAAYKLPVVSARPAAGSIAAAVACQCSVHSAQYGHPLVHSNCWRMCVALSGHACRPARMKLLSARELDVCLTPSRCMSAAAIPVCMQQGIAARTVATMLDEVV
jgi:hypothetical protein